MRALRLLVQLERWGWQVLRRVAFESVPGRVDIWLLEGPLDYI